LFLGIDIGTSSIKSVLVDGRDRVLASATAALEVSRPQPGFSEQDPEHWWRGVEATLDEIKAKAPREMAAVQGIGLSGQMHGATLLDDAGKVLRPCILWNDGRSAKECAELEAGFPDLHRVTGNLAMPGFTAPKLLWVRNHEPEIFARIAMVLLPKAYVRYRLTGDYVEEMSDAAGTLWLDVGKRAWSDAALSATHLTREQMPRLVEGSAVSGTLHKELAQRWGMATPPVVAGGAGDNAAGAVGLGAIHDGDAFLSLGTSGVLWVTTAKFAPNPSSAAHAFCHAIPDTWDQMGVILSAAASLSWLSGLLGESEADLLRALGEKPSRPSPVTFLPYLTGERTPHNDAAIRGMFYGLTPDTDRREMTQAVLEGVAFAFKDCRAALEAAGSKISSADVIGGGSRSPFWIRVLASALDLPLNRLAEGETGAAIGAARLGRLAATGESPAAVCRPPERMETIAPDRVLTDAYAESYRRYKAFYPAIKGVIR
jgi:xylulokinase